VLVGNVAPNGDLGHARAVYADLAKPLSFCFSDQRSRHSMPIRTACRIARLLDDVNNDVVSDANTASPGTSKAG
jgi:hypothetical protein